MERKETVIEKRERPTHVYFVCDTGIGSSAVAASLFRKRIKKELLEGICVEHTAIDNIPEDAEVVFVQKSFEAQLKNRQEDTEYYFFESVTQDPVFETFIRQWKEL